MSRTRLYAQGYPDEAWLIARAIENDGAAVRLIMQRNNRRLYRIARSVVRDDSEAEDVVQEARLHSFATVPRSLEYRHFADDDKVHAGRQEHDRYESWLDAETKRRVNALSKAERNRIETSVRAQYPASAMPALIAIGIKVALQRHVNEGNPLPDFEAWKRARARA